MDSTIKKLPQPLILFDGVCNWCVFWVQFIIRRDPGKMFHFASLQSPVGQKILKKLGLPNEDFKTMIFVENDRYFTKSSAALKIIRRMGGFWPIIYVFIVIPSGIRDLFYDFVAKNRYGWFGRKKECLQPSPDLKDRFLEE